MLIRRIKRGMSNLIMGYYGAKYTTELSEGILPCFDKYDMQLYVPKKDTTIAVNIHTDYYPHLGKMLFGMYGKNMPLAVTHVGWSNREDCDMYVRMTVNREYLDLEDSYRWAILAHECGHIVHHFCEGHVDGAYKEIDADNYAVELGYGLELRAILHRYKDTIVENGGMDVMGDTMTELWCRIDNLNLQCRWRSLNDI